MFNQLDELRKERLKSGDYTWRVLRYQRVIDPNLAPYPIPTLKNVHPDIFEKQMRYLAKHCLVVPLEKLIEDITNEHEIPDRTVAITLDCGWLDQLVYAVPILKKLELPATFFIPTAFIGTNNYFWQDKVMFTLLMMQSSGMNFIPFDFLTDSEREALVSISPNGEINLDYVSTLILIMQGLSPVNLITALTILGELAEHLGGAIPGEPVFMSWGEIKLLMRNGFTIGSIGHRFAPFSGMTADEFMRDTVSSFALIEELGYAHKKLLAIPEDYMTDGLLKNMSNSPAFDFAFGIKPPGVVSQLLQHNERNIILRHAVHEPSSKSVESFATNLWL